MANLLLQAESTREIPLTLDEEILGRSGNCSVSIHSVIVSRRHAEFRRNAGIWSVKDLNSVNGVYVNCKKIDPTYACKLKSEYLISLGPIHRTNMVFQFVQDLDDPDAKLVSLNTVFWLSAAANKLIYTPAGVTTHGKTKTRETAIPERNNEENEEEPHTEQVSPPALSSSSSSRCVTSLVPETKPSSAIKRVQGSTVDLTHDGATQQDVVKRVESIMEEELTCSICSELFINAVTLPCGHNFCQVCIRSWRRKKDTCPMCNSPIVQEIRSYVLDSVIKQLVSLNPHLKKHYDTRCKL